MEHGPQEHGLGYTKDMLAVGYKIVRVTILFFKHLAKKP